MQPLYQNIILTGFMGTGKSTVGQQVAKQLNWPFVDMDDLIETQQGCTIRQLFATKGEAYFRQLESKLCLELTTWQNHVIATGGGTLVNPHNLATLSTNNLIICLDCNPQILWQRLAEATNRPMLDDTDKKERLLSLLQSRQAAYAKIKHHLDTSNQSIEQLANNILTLIKK